MRDQNVTPKVIATVWRHWRAAFSQSKMAITGIILFYSIAMYFELMYQPLQFKKVFDALAEDANPWPAFQLVIVALAVGWVCNRIGDWFVVIGESKVIKDLKDYCMCGLLGKNTHFFTTHSSGALVAKSKRFVNVSEKVIDEFIFSIIRSVFFTFYLVIYASLLIPELAPAFIIWVTLFVALTIVASRIRMRYDLLSSKIDSITTGHISDILLSIFTLRVFGAVSRVQKTFNEVTSDDLKKRRKAWFVGNAQWALQSLLVILLQVYCMGKIIGEVQSGKYSLGTAVLVQAYIASLASYMWNFGRSFINVRTSFADAHEMAELLDEESSEPVENEFTRIIPIHNGISFSEVTFGYTDDRHALKNFSFEFLPGRRYGIVGKTGSGKSTLTKLMLRAYDQNSGDIKICSEPLQDINKLVLRSWISYVPQDPQFPSWTVREIISMGHHNASEEKILLAAQKASCDFIWDKLPKGLDTKVGERGVRLSGGERQRLAIAAAILKDAPIVIMDEPTSALDAQTESAIQQVIQEHFKGKTLIIIAHRLATVAVLDEIVLIENGKVKDFGPHDSLLKTSNDYKEMWELQTTPHYS